MSWQIYGPARGNGSWKRVAAGLVEGLLTNGQDVTFFPTDNIGHDLDGALPAGFDADVGIFVGSPAHARMMRGQGAHKERWLMLAPNSTWLPRDVLAELERNDGITGYLTPSAWGADILAGRLGGKPYTELPVRVWHHGVDGALLDGAEDHHKLELVEPLRSPHEWRALHLSSSQAGRKSTHELVRTFVKIHVGNPYVGASPSLLVIVDGPVGDVLATRDRAVAEFAGPDADPVRCGVRVEGRRDFNSRQLGNFMASFDCVIQPSRSEGFGMVPLEARAAGVPVIMTNGTGHQDHVPPRDPRDTTFVGNIRDFPGGYFTAGGVCVVEVSDDAPIDDGPDGRAPTVPLDALEQAIRLSVAGRHRFSVWAAHRAEAVYRRWCWRMVTRTFLALHQEAVGPYTKQS